MGVESKRHRSYYFITTAYEDPEFLSLRGRIPKEHERNLHHILSSYISEPSKSLKYGFEVNLHSRDARLLSYRIVSSRGRTLSVYSAQLLTFVTDTLCLSNTITTINDATNGFRMVLLPNALGDQSLSYTCLDV
jgi:hypothetical protein